MLFLLRVYSLLGVFVNRQRCLTILMCQDIGQHIAEDYQIGRESCQFFIRQAFAEFAGDGGEIKIPMFGGV